MLLSFLVATAAAACDIKALQTSFEAASPAGAGKIYAELAACDPTVAKTYAPTAFAKIIAGEGGDAAALAGIGVGAGADVRGWVSGREPSERSAVLKVLGASCDKSGVPTFFTDSAKAMGDKFWSEAWYSGLASCQDAGVQEILRAAVQKPKAEARYYSILAIFSQNAGKNAIPVLKALLEAHATEAELATNLVSAFTYAAGTNPEARALAVATLVELAPKLPAQAVNQARTTLIGLGAEAESDALVAVRFKDAVQTGGGLLYGMVIVDVATCKKSDQRVEVHVAQVMDSGHTWPDQLLERAKVQAASKIELDLADRCKGTGTQEYLTPAEPFKDAAAFDAWVEEQLKAVEKKYPEIKAKRIDDDSLSI